MRNKREIEMMKEMLRGNWIVSEVLLHKMRYEDHNPMYRALDRSYDELKFALEYLVRNSGGEPDYVFRYFNEDTCIDSEDY